MSNHLDRPIKPLLKDLRSLIGSTNPRTLRAFEDLFDAVPSDLNALGDRVAQNEQDIDAIEDFIFKEIQFKSVDYALLEGDSGVALDTDGGDLIVTMPDAELWANEDKFIQNAGSNRASVELFGTQTVSGVDVLLIPSNLPHVSALLRSDGQNLILLSDRDGGNLIGAQYWETKNGEQMTTKNGDNLVFRV